MGFTFKVLNFASHCTVRKLAARWGFCSLRSAVIQTSAVHGGMCADPAAALAELFARRVA